MEYELKGTELRIGNWISYRGEKDLVVSCIPSKYGEVLTERHSKFGDNIYVGSNDLMDYEPIRLTEDWLIKLRFEKTNPTWFRACAIGLSININLEGDLFLYFNNSYIDLPVKCLYVHQLQNIFYIIAGEDLNFDSSPQSS